MFFNFSQWYLYLQMRDFLENRISAEVTSLAESTAGHIDPFVASEVAADAYLLADYADLAGTLEEVRRARGLLGVSMYDTEGEDLLAGLGDTAEEDVKLLNLTEFVSAAAGIAASTPIYRSDSLYLLAAFAPIYGPGDSVVAVLQVEAGYAVFRTLEEFKRNIVLMNVGSLFFMVLFVALFYFVNRRLLMAQQALLRASAISSMGEMAATIAHEIRNPLGIIKNSAERIRRKYSQETDDPVFDFISEEVDRLNSIIAGYLDFAHPVRGKREKIDLRRLVEALADQTRTDFAQAGIQVAVSCGTPDGLYQVVADRFAVRQAILNIMLNAKAAQPDGGRLDVSITSDRWNGMNGVRIDVADKGVGIPPGLADRLFDPFFTTREKGSGLGLYVAKSVVDAHDGEVIIKPNTAGGTVVSVFLPEDG
jgi:signal transduction histidine kinase